MNLYKNKYLKYKNKYFELKKLISGATHKMSSENMFLISNKYLLDMPLEKLENYPSSVEVNNRRTGNYYTLNEAIRLGLQKSMRVFLTPEIYYADNPLAEVEKMQESSGPEDTIKADRHTVITKCIIGSESFACVCREIFIENIADIINDDYLKVIKKDLFGQSKYDIAYQVFYFLITLEYIEKVVIKNNSFVYKNLI